MNLHQILKTVPPQWHAVAAHYVKILDTAGVPADKIDRLVQWGLNYSGPGEESDLLSAFRGQAARLGLSDDTTALAADLGLEARETINSGKFTPEQVQPDENARLLEDIRNYRRQWPHDWDQDAEMQAAERRLIAANLGEEPEASAAPVRQRSDAEMRMMEIRQIRRDDPIGWDSNKALQAEELALIESSLPTSAPAEAAPTQSGDPA